MNEKNLEELTASCPDNLSIDVSTISHDTNFLYKIHVPFEITYGCCSGGGSDDYINLTTLSEKGAYFSQETVELHNYVFQNLGGHYHNYYEFLIVLNGEVHQQIEGKDFLYTSGTCCLINRNLVHKEYYTGKCQLLFLGLSPKFIDQLIQSFASSYFEIEKELKDTELYHFVTSDLQKSDSKMYLDFIPRFQNTNAKNILHEITESLMQELLFPAFGSTFQVQASICKIINYLSSDHFHCTVVNLDDNSDRLLFSHIEHLLAESDGRLSRAELAASLNYSGDYINRIIKKYAGMCLHNFAMEFCLKKAAELIRSSNRSVSDIAVQLGFSNRTYFYRIFKEKYGVTPREYRVRAS